MELILKNSYKSLKRPLIVEINNFTIITGINGAGKTQFLEAINLSHFKDKSDLGLNPQIIKYFQPSSFRIEGHNGYSQSAFRQTASQTLSILQNVRNHKVNNDFSVSGAIRDKTQHEILKRIAALANKGIWELSDDDIYEYYPLDGNIHTDIFAQNFAEIFKKYQIKFEQNLYNKFKNESFSDKEFKFYTEEEFNNQFGFPPWTEINRIIAEANLDYYMTSPSLTSHRDDSFQLKLVNKINDAAVDFSSLSSGEKVLMSLVFALYNSKLDRVIPNYLLLDEPDASLHPSMTKQFLNVIENVFVKEKGIKVVMTTHSPSTVALAKEESLYVMNKTEPRIEKISKDKALKILTTGVPSLSINYENRKQIFVESDYDVEIYEKIYRKLGNQLESEISLDFISSGVGGRGNCSQVIEVVDKLTGFGNKSIFGIIDWDGKNQEGDYVKVLGKDKRYAIENFVLDPILISALLLDLRRFNKEDLNLLNNETYTDFKNLKTSQLQYIADFFFNEITSTFTILDNTKTTVKYLNGLEIEIPLWYLTHQGYDLEEKLKLHFGELRRFHQEGKLKKEIVNKIIDDIPQLIPVEFLELFKSIQNQ